MRPRIFVGSSREVIDVARAVQLELTDDFDVTVWDQDVFQLGYGALDSLLDALDSSDAGVFVLAPDDVTTTRGTSEPTVRDNVLFELGMFIGRLGRDRAFMLTPRGTTLRLPSDLLGLTTAQYEAGRDRGRVAVGPACTRIRDRLDSSRMRVADEPEARARLDRAMARLSRDLELVLGRRELDHNGTGSPVSRASVRIGRVMIEVDVGRIQDFAPSDERSIVVLPANEYFDDECMTDTNSSLGAFVMHHFGDRVDEFLHEVHAGLGGLPTQRVPRAERRLDDSYGIGQTVYISRLAPEHRVMLVSATTERTGIGLRAEPHFLYAAIQGAIERMNEHRLNSLVIPVLGSGHGGMPLSVALLFNLLALRSTLDDVGRHIRRVQLVIFEGAATDVTDAALRDVFSRVAPAS